MSTDLNAIREQSAEIIHSAMRFDRMSDTPVWVGGNSLAEDAARKAAGMIEELYLAAIEASEAARVKAEQERDALLMPYGDGLRVEHRSVAAKKARDALDAAHSACFNAPHRDVLGMSTGPFSGVNYALGVIASQDELIGRLRRALESRP